jgi:hypothetical protein
MADYLITCINRPHCQSDHEHITHIGNVAGNWRVTTANAIYRITHRADSFYTLNKDGARVDIAVVHEAGNQPYLRTRAEGEWDDNLLAQKECGTDCHIVA